ncbi:YihY/virulence factor BrkB family protein [Paracoccus jeotgali]|uniref:Ribonuclease BN n=1 Tax=Paracoccus jeotgali TaxID=2065379 RepID=A0A2K9MGD9_9RHOB|nr:YihY/virulence factor BrkB family protein [Paracoccus jeotgali]AUM74680.1 ribonuclease BN [Paracoccus jeotgali]
MRTPTPPERSVLDAVFDPLPDSMQPENPPAADKAEAKAEPESTPVPTGPAPDTVWGLKFKQWWAVLKDTVTEIGEDRVTSVAGGVTFFAILALFPAITALVSLFGVFADPALVNEQLDNLGKVVPPSALEIIRGQVQEIIKTPGTALSVAGIVGLLVTLWSANGGMKALIDGLNVALFQSEERGFIKLNLISLAMTVGAMVLVMLLVLAVAVLPAVLHMLPLVPDTKAILTMLRWPIMFAVLLLAISALYRWGPSRRAEGLGKISPGAVLATVGLIITSAGFSFYTSNFASYNETYGTLGAAVVLMMWMWLSSIVIMVGAEVNSVAAEHLREMKGEPKLSKRK